MLRSKVWSREPSALSDSRLSYLAVNRELETKTNLGDQAPVARRLIAAAAGTAAEPAGERR